MSKFIITGQKTLKGEINVSGSKNAVLPIMAASLLTRDECVLTNVPKIKDVETMAEIMSDLGAVVSFTDHRLVIKAQDLKKSSPLPTLVSKLRGSILLLGPMLARMHSVEMPFPGGDLIGSRSIDSHLSALKELGALVDLEKNVKVKVKVRELKGNKIVLEESSVTATENLIMASVLAKGKTLIKLAAMEPHVQALGEFLNLMGARITGLGTTVIEIEGVESLHGASFQIISDSSEAASFITLAAATRGNVKVTNLDPDHLDDFLLKMKQMNVNLEIGKDYVQVLPPSQEYVGIKIQCGLYPKLNSDYVPPMAVLATVARGETYIYEWMYENRLGHIPELKKMGAKAEILDPHRVKIIGPTQLVAQNIKTYDLRMGMTLVIAALIAKGTSEISDIHHIDRGYENLEEKLRAIGAEIKRID